MLVSDKSPVVLYSI